VSSSETWPDVAGSQDPASRLCASRLPSRPQTGSVVANFSVILSSCSRRVAPSHPPKCSERPPGSETPIPPTHPFSSPSGISSYNRHRRRISSAHLLTSGSSDFADLSTAIRPPSSICKSFFLASSCSPGRQGSQAIDELIAPLVLRIEGGPSLPPSTRRRNNGATDQDPSQRAEDASSPSPRRS
jgi:hypothetical protein